MSVAHRPTVDYCKKSTITEAWTVVLGLPGPVDETDPPVLERTAKKKIDGLQRKPAIVAVNATGEAVPPFWTQQVTWNDRQHLARFGHRYLSVHFIRQSDVRYTRFADVLEPAIAEWLGIYTDALGGGSSEHPVDRIGFGYVNRFSFSATDFDLSRYFSINVGIEIGAPDAGLLGLTSAFRFFDPERTMYITVDLAAESVPGDAGEVGVTTKVFAERRGLEDLTFADGEAVGEQIRNTKEAAKGVFFSFATEETRALMEVVHASDGS